MKTQLAALFDRDIQRLYKEIDSYTVEEDLWKTSAGISNSAGNLALHICGNLQYFIGTNLAKNGYVRNRPLEFSDKVAKETLLALILQTQKTLASAFQIINTEMLESEYCEEVLGYKMRTDYFLMHLNGHLNYHLGQINYHKRILCYN